MKKQFRITLNGKSYEVVAELMDESDTNQGPAHSRRPARSSGAKAVQPPASKPMARPASGNGTVASPLAGKVVSIDVALDDTVDAGQQVITLEAMKMNTVVSAPIAGTVSSIDVHAGDSVEEGQTLLVLK